MSTRNPDPAARGAHIDALTLGRYVLHGEIASGGMATVYFGRLVGPVGFTRIVAVKRMHAHFAEDPEFVAMFVDEARLAARIQHPNVTSTLDVVAEGGEIFIIMEYVRGEALSGLLDAARARGERVPVPIAASVAIGALAGLHAAHEARGDEGEPLGIVHRDVSPQNVLVGLDGLARIVDFGIAKATTLMLETTQDGQVRGKLRYIAPEQLALGPERKLDRRLDVFATGVVLWEVLAGRRLYGDDEPAEVVRRLLAGDVPPLRGFRTDVSPQLESVVRRALRLAPDDRYASAADFAMAIEAASPRVASQRAVGAWVSALGASVIAQRDARLHRIESTPTRELDSALVQAATVAPPAAREGARRGGTRVHRVPPATGSTPTTGLLPAREARVAHEAPVALEVPRAREPAAVPETTAEREIETRAEAVVPNRPSTRRPLALGAAIAAAGAVAVGMILPALPPADAPDPSPGWATSAAPSSAVVVAEAEAASAEAGGGSSLRSAARETAADPPSPVPAPVERAAAPANSAPAPARLANRPRSRPAPRATAAAAPEPPPRPYVADRP